MQLLLHYSILYLNICVLVFYYLPEYHFFYIIVFYMYMSGRFKLKKKNRNKSTDTKYKACATTITKALGGI